MRQDVPNRKNEYLTSWNESLKKISDADLRKRAEQRMGQAVEMFDTLAKSADAARAKFDPFLKSLKDIGTTLEHDLTADGVKGVNDVIQRVSQEANAVKTDVTSLVDSMNKIADHVATPPAPAPETPPK